MGNFNVPKNAEKPPQIIDLFSQEMEAKFMTEGKLYRRKIEPIRGVEPVTEPQVVETRMEDGTLESSVEAKPGEYIITGVKGEKFVLPAKKVDDLYESDGQGGYIPKERKIIALENPLRERVKTIAPWSKPEKIEYAEGSEKCFLVAALDENGKMTSDRYIIGDKGLLLGNYEPA